MLVFYTLLEQTSAHRSPAFKVEAAGCPGWDSGAAVKGRFNAVKEKE